MMPQIEEPNMSLEQQNALKLIRQFMQQQPPLETAARALDKKYRLGYFDKLVQDAKPQMEQWLNKFLTTNIDMVELKKQVRTLANTEDAVLVVGETGTGKEIIANALHGNKSPETFVSINCAGLPEHLIESELFGHERGAFTGATERKPGLFKMADKGTLFLDEIGELPHGLQAKLLRAIQEKSIRRVGSLKEEPITCRFIAATHCNLEELVKVNKFRKDLYYRISTIELKTLPIVPDRYEDIELIVDNLDTEKKFPRDFNWRRVSHLLDGNVRSIQKIIRRYQLFGVLPTY